MNRECAAVITSTGSNVSLPSSSGILLGGNHRSHCAASPGCPDQPIRRIDRPMLRPQPPHVVPEPGDRSRSSRPARRSPSPASPGCPQQHRPHPRSNGVNDVGYRRPLILRRPIRSHRPRHRRPPDPQIPRDLPLRNPIRDKPPDQRPILQRDHPSNLSGWPRFRPSLWPRFQASSTIGLIRRRPIGRALVGDCLSKDRLDESRIVLDARDRAVSLDVD